MRKSTLNRDLKIIAAKNYLNIIRTNQMRIWQLRFDRQQLKLEYDGQSGIDYAKDRIQATPENAIEQAGWKLLERVKKIDDQINHLSDDRFRRIDEIYKLTDERMIMVLSLYYVHALSQKRVGEYMGYSEKQVNRIYRNALALFYDLFLVDKK